MRVSAIIPVYNCERYLAQAIDSALAQEEVEVEVVVVDDGSTDRSGDVIASYGDRVRALRQENRGLSAARNAGIAASTGEFIALLDADDLWEPSKSRIEAAHLDAHPRCGLVFCDAMRIDEEGHRLAPMLGPAAAAVPTGMCLDRLFMGNYVLVPGVMMRRSIVDAAGPFDESLRSIEDYDLWLRIAEVAEIGFIPETLACWRDRPGQMTKKRDVMLFYEVLVLERALDRNPGLRRRLGRQVHRRFARLFDYHAWGDLEEGLTGQALRKFLRAAAHDPFWIIPYRHLVAVALYAAGLWQPSRGAPAEQRG